jgi:hypothetical protein
MSSIKLPGRHVPGFLDRFHLCLRYGLYRLLAMAHCQASLIVVILLGICRPHFKFLFGDIVVRHYEILLFLHHQVRLCPVENFLRQVNCGNKIHADFQLSTHHSAKSASIAFPPSLNRYRLPFLERLIKLVGLTIGACINFSSLY